MGGSRFAVFAYAVMYFHSVFYLLEAHPADVIFSLSKCPEVGGIRKLFGLHLVGLLTEHAPHGIKLLPMRSLSIEMPSR